MEEFINDFETPSVEFETPRVDVVPIFRFKLDTRDLEELSELCELQSPTAQIYSEVYVDETKIADDLSTLSKQMSDELSANHQEENPRVPPLDFSGIVKSESKVQSKANSRKSSTEVQSKVSQSKAASAKTSTHVSTQVSSKTSNQASAKSSNQPSTQVSAKVSAKTSTQGSAHASAKTSAHASAKTSAKTSAVTSPRAPSKESSTVCSPRSAKIASQNISKVPSQSNSKVPSQSNSKVPSQSASRVPSLPTSRVPSQSASRVPSQSASRVPSLPTSRLHSRPSSQPTSPRLPNVVEDSEEEFHEVELEPIAKEDVSTTRNRKTDRRILAADLSSELPISFRYSESVNIDNEESLPNYEGDWRIWLSSGEDQLEILLEQIYEDERKYKKMSSRNGGIARVIQLSLLFIGCGAVYLSSVGADANTIIKYNVASGAGTTICSTLLGFCAFSDKASHYAVVKSNLQRLRSWIESKLVLPENKRFSPYDIFIISKRAYDAIMLQATEGLQDNK